MERAAQLVEEGRALARQEKNTSALAAFNTALQLEPGFRPAALAKAVLLEDLGRLEEAVAAYDALLLQYPGDVAACSNRAGLLLQLEQPEAALASLDQALAADPANDLLALNKGLLLLQGLNDPAAARPWLERARDAGFAEAADALNTPPPPRD